MLMLRSAVALVVIVAPCMAFATVDDLAAARDHAAVVNTSLLTPAASPVDPIQAAAHRAVTHMVSNATDASSDVSHAATTSPRRGWIARHPVLFGALAGATVGTAVAAAAWGGEGAFVGLYGGAAAGAVVAAVLR